MIAYRAARRVALLLRSVQTALLGASFLASDYAHSAARQAKASAVASINSSLDTAYKRVERLGEAADAAQARFEDAADEYVDIREDFGQRLAMIEKEVL